MRWLLHAVVLTSCLLMSLSKDAPPALHLTTNDEGYLTGIQGFALELQCLLNTCSPKVAWYKDDVMFFNATTFVNASGVEESAVKLLHNVDVDIDKGCSGTCKDGEPCAEGFACVDNQCCACTKEDFTLVLKNLTDADSGRYRCAIENQTDQLEFQVEILESGLSGGFHENISYDHSECCQRQGMSESCRAMCKPSEMNVHHFDPTSCTTDDYKHFLTCATNNGTRSHVHCCKTQLVPSFCYEFCSGDFQYLRRSHRLCLYYMLEIFDCYNRAYLPYPDAPEKVTVNSVEHDQLNVCWKPPQAQESNKNFPIIDYTVFYKEIPNFPLLGGESGLPHLLSGDYADIGDLADDYSEGESNAEAAPEEGGLPVQDPKTRKKRSTKESYTDVDLSFPSGLTAEGEENLRETFKIRRKRQMMVIMANNGETNSTITREFNYKHLTTNSTCATLKDLRSATQYIVYVTARNEYGPSVPSVRSIASTNILKISNNESIPDAMKCCIQNNVSSVCAAKMCNVMEEPSPFTTISVATTCRSEWPKVSPCITDKRNNTECCVRKGVQSECLKICNGDSDPLGIQAVLCLNLDLPTVFHCIRESYETHPSAPENLTVTQISDTSAVFEWAEPDTNAHLVETYTLFIRRNEYGAPVREVFNAVSPHTELGLVPDSEYSVAVQSNSNKGMSLPSTVVLFQTLAQARGICAIGEPLLISEGRPFLCSLLNPCPAGFGCTDIGDEAYCCQKESMHSDADFQECCTDQKVSEECMPSCYYNATLPDTCKRDLNKWVQCASEAHDHTLCCQEQNVPKQCMSGCRHPFQVPDTCFESVSLLSSCFAGHKNGIPNAVKNVEITLISSDGATLSWEDREMDVNYYTIELFLDGRLINTTNCTADIFRFEKLSPTSEYKARVTAVNDHGSSPPSLSVTFVTLPLNIEHGELPKAPDGIKIAWNYGNKVNVTWNKVTVRRDGSPVNGTIQYILHYTYPDTATTKWAEKKTSETWAVMEDLTKDALYSTYITSEENGKSSRSSSVITILASPDKFGLPEPVIILEPDHKDSVYMKGDAIKVNCSMDIDVSKLKDNKHLNIDLTAGSDASETNDHGAAFVVKDIVAEQSIDTITCAVTDTDGRQNVAMRHLLVKYGPVVSMKSEKVRAFVDKSAEIVCNVEGYPAPAIHFEKDGNRAFKNELRIKQTGAHKYSAWLYIKNATQNDGLYKCVATSGDVSAEATAEVIISKEHLPINPKLILSCCEEQHIEGDCLQACTIGKVPKKVGNCSQYAPALLSCANDPVLDHSECCSRANVTKRCIPMCSGDSYSQDVDCSDDAVKIMGCFVRGHEGSPPPLNGVVYEVLERGKVKVKWDDNSDENTFKFYAVYYKRKNDDSDYKMEKVLEKSITLPVDAESDYEIAVVSANAFGHGPASFLVLPSTASEKAGHKSTGWSGWFVFFLLVVIASVLAGFIFVVRSRELPRPIGSLLGRKPAARDAPSVAFENPAYGSEVEIRGLRGDRTTPPRQNDWQSQDLQVSQNDETETRNGMRYAKLNT